MTHTFGYVYKFVYRIRRPGLDVEDVKMGTQMLIRSIQMSNLADDYWRLHSKRQITSSSPLSSLSPFIDSIGVMRVGGRLQNSSLDYNAQHPVILPRKHPVTRAIILDLHRKNLHSGPRALLASMRLQFWPIGGRKTVSAATSKCIICFRAKPQLAQHLMADLPKDRVNATSTFMVTGLDFCGPFCYKTGVRSKMPVKTYVCVFICYATKAIHLELVQDLSTQAFFGALKRFILTRGKPARIWSDNATNFVGAKNELAELRSLFLSGPHIRAIEEFCLEDSIEWQNPADLEVLTPAHFLGTFPLVLYSEPDVTNLNFNRLDRWQRIAYLQQIFWSRWREEYLTLLQQRSKWRTSKPALQVNDVVLVQNDNLPPLKWPLARVMELVPGSDGVARVAVIRTATATTRRAVRKLYVLPKQDLVESPGLPTGGECSVMPQPN
ncbi:uncharacterized protein [Drosophila takahashii]|uniref:uncharacterized protein n=1 Tax=Drosophila takahashii TaxID=29030 RepID=UPI003898E05C